MIGFVLGLAVLGVVALLAVVLPVLRAGAPVADRARYDSAVYRDQLRELERDVARGLIGAAEAGAARLEIERRLLAAADAARPAAPPSRRSPALAAAIAVLVLGGAAGLYLRLGAPGVPDLPFALRVAEGGAPSDANHPDLAKMAAALAERLQRDPDSREGWRLYARTLATMGNWQGSADAWRNLIALGDTGADTYAGYGEMQVLGSQGAVTPAAREAFGNALKADPANQVARFYMAAADAQAGRFQPAIDAWVKLAAETPDEDMRGEIARRVAEAARLGGLTAPPLPPAPAADMSEAGRSDMIRGMVAQLATRLEAQPGDADGWLRLGRAYAVLGEHDKSASAYARAAALRPTDVSVLMQGVEALIEAQPPNSPIPPPAVELLRRAEQADAKRPEVLWYLGLAEAQAGHAEAAQGFWRRLLDLLPRESQDRKMVTDAIAALPQH